MDERIAEYWKENTMSIWIMNFELTDEERDELANLDDDEFDAREFEIALEDLSRVTDTKERCKMIAAQWKDEQDAYHELGFDNEDMIQFILANK